MASNWEKGQGFSKSADEFIARQLEKFTGDQDFDEMLRKCNEILGVKGNDYTIGNVDRLHNFKTVAGFVGLDPMQVLGVYFYKHVAAIFAYIKSGGKSQSEPISGRIADCINYMLLFYKMVKEFEREGAKNV